MMQARTIVVIVSAVVVTILAMQNITPVEIRFLFWNFSLPVVLVIGISLVLGFIIGFVLRAILVFSKSRDLDDDSENDEKR